MTTSSRPEHWELVDSVAVAAHDPMEDAWGVRGPVAWMLDGASSVGGPRTGVGSAAWLVAAARRGIDAALDEGVRAPVELLDGACEAIAAGMGGRRLDDPPSAAAAIVALDGRRVHWALLGDVSVVVHTGAEELVLEDPGFAEHNAAIDADLRSVLVGAGDISRAMEVLRPSLRRRRQAMNRAGGYWILSGDPAGVRHAARGTVDAEDAATVVLATDGFARAVRELQLYDSWSALLAEAGHHGLSEIAGRIRDAERADPGGRYPRLGVHDDCTAIILRPRRSHRR